MLKPKNSDYWHKEIFDWLKKYAPHGAKEPFHFSNGTGILQHAERVAERLELSLRSRPFQSVGAEVSGVAVLLATTDSIFSSHHAAEDRPVETELFAIAFEFRPHL